MMILMGGKGSLLYKRFVDLTIAGFLAAREIMDEVIAVVCAHADSGLPCFTFKDTTLVDLRGRFLPDLSAYDAATYMLKLINNANNNITTMTYDMLQNCTNGIEY